MTEPSAQAPNAARPAEPDSAGAQARPPEPDAAPAPAAEAALAAAPRAAHPAPGTEAAPAAAPRAAQAAAAAPEPRHVRLWREGRLALDLVGRPGILVSTSAPPPLPGQGPVTHPFATATAYVAEWEGELGAMLRAAPSMDDFLATAAALGYDIQADDA